MGRKVQRALDTTVGRESIKNAKTVDATIVR